METDALQAAQLKPTTIQATSLDLYALLVIMRQRTTAMNGAEMEEDQIIQIRLTPGKIFSD